VFCAADALLATHAGNARRMLTDAEVVTLAVAQVLLGYHDSDRRLLAAATRRLVHRFPVIPTQDAVHKRRARLGASIEWLIGVFASQSPGYDDNPLLLDSTPVETARSRETITRAGDSALADAIGDAAGYSRLAPALAGTSRPHLHPPPRAGSMHDPQPPPRPTEPPSHALDGYDRGITHLAPQRLVRARGHTDVPRASVGADPAAARELDGPQGDVRRAMEQTSFDRCQPCYTAQRGRLRQR
jgi:hypothetical protein